MRKGMDFMDSKNVLYIYKNDSLPISKNLKSSGVKTILFEGGVVHRGNILLKGLDGLNFGSFGTEPAIIDGCDGFGIILKGCTDIKISGIMIKGSGWRDNKGGTGLYFEECRDIAACNIEVTGFQKAGIAIEASENVKVEGCYTYRNGFCGISCNYGRCKNKNIIIRHCRVYDNAGDHSIKDNHSGSGIAIYCTDGILVEYCEAAGNGWAQRQKNHNGPVGIWCACGAENVIFRKCISHHNRTQPGGVDGDGFDIDGAVVNGFMEYNYSYENEGSGYLFCEYGSGQDWKNNNMRYCISINDALRVQRQGAVQYYGPPPLKLEGSETKKCFFVPAHNKHCIVDSELGSDCNGIKLDNCLMLKGIAEITDCPVNPNIKIDDNVIIDDTDLYYKYILNVQRLTEPRRLDNLPVLKYLEDGTLAEKLYSLSVEELFDNNRCAFSINGKLRFTYFLNGCDFEGSEYSGRAELCFDSMKPGTALRLTGKGSCIRFEYPSWDSSKRHLAVLKARAESSLTQGCLYISEDDRIVKLAAIAGNAGEYNNICLEFDGFDGVPFIGIMVNGGEGSIYAEQIEVYELLSNTENYNNRPPQERDKLLKYRTFGDVYSKAGDIILNKSGAMLVSEFYADSPDVSLKAEISCTEGSGILFLENGGVKEFSEINIDMTEYKLTLHKCSGFIRYGVICKEAADENSITVKNITINREG